MLSIEAPICIYIYILQFEESLQVRTSREKGEKSSIYSRNRYKRFENSTVFHIQSEIFINYVEYDRFNWEKLQKRCKK